MNVADERSMSCWMQDAPAIEASPLQSDQTCDTVNRIEAICREEGIDADFARVDGFLFPAEESHRADLEEEYEACRKINVDVDWVDRAPVPGIDTGKALRFSNQGRLHPTKYLAGLARAILARGGRLYALRGHGLCRA